MGKGCSRSPTGGWPGGYRRI